MVRIETNDLIIQDHAMEYCEEHIKLICDPLVMYYVDLEGISNRTDALNNFLEAYQESLSEHRQKFFFIIIEKSTKKFVGEVGYHIVGNNAKGLIGHVGYFSNSAFWNKGYMTQALMAVIKFASRNGIALLETGCFHENIASEKVMRKCGFKKVREFLVTYDGEKKLRVEYELSLVE